MNVYCAEVAWMKCLDGMKIPLEIAIASVEDPDIVYIVEICLPMNLGLTLRDMAETKSYGFNKDRYANLLFTRGQKKLEPKRIIRLKLDGWLPAFRDVVTYLLGPNFTLFVRCPSQMKFFNQICGFGEKVRYANCIANGEAYGCWHKHGRLIRYLCPATEARTMAVKLKFR